MHKIVMSTYKEMLLLSRDLGGLVILFVMPLVLIITITSIQDSSFKSIKNSRIPILFVDNDKGNLAKTIFENINESDAFEMMTVLHDKKVTEQIARNEVLNGNYKFAVVIPEGISKILNVHISQNVSKILSDLGVEDAPKNEDKVEKKEIKLYFDPAVQGSFKEAILNTIGNMISKIESRSIYKAFQNELTEDGAEISADLENANFISFTEISPKGDARKIIPNSTQHNVPAWTLFAIFFIVIPLSINIVKEKNQGTFVRLRTNPVHYSVILAGKTITYLLVCVVQFLLMLLVGAVILPLLGLPPLEIGANFMALLIVALFSGLAAIGFGILLGTLATTQEQSAPFGATAVVILAAIGGVWVPVFMMPTLMQTMAKMSPMNWGLNAFYDVFLREGGIKEILPEISLLLLFFILTLAISIIYDKKKRTV